MTKRADDPKEARQAAGLEARLLADLAWVLSDQRGRRFIHWLRAKNGEWDDFPVGCPERTERELGKRAVALAVRRLAKALIASGSIGRDVLTVAEAEYEAPAAETKAAPSPEAGE